MTDHDQAFDAAMADELARFARNVASGDVRVAFKGGVARIEGWVTSDTQARALADLILNHQGVSHVDSQLRVHAPMPTSDASQRR